MPGELSTPGANIALDAVTGRVAAAARTTYIGLASAAITDATTLATVAELTTAGYARQAVTWTAPAGDPSETHNSAQFGYTFTGDPPNVPWAFLTDVPSGTGGSILAWWQLDVAKDPAAGESLNFPTGNASLTDD